MSSSENSCEVQSKVVITHSRRIELFVVEIPELGPRMASTGSKYVISSQLIREKARMHTRIRGNNAWPATGQAASR